MNAHVLLNSLNEFGKYEAWNRNARLLTLKQNAPSPP